MRDSINIVEVIEGDRPDMTRAFRRIADFLAERPEDFISKPMRELSEAVGVSEPSLIRFARRYGHKGFPDLRLSVAMSLAATGTRYSDRLEPTLADKQVVRRDAKQEIARAAARLVEEDSSIVIDSGSTATCMAVHLARAQPLTILSTGLNTLLALQECTQHSIIVPGGVLRPAAMALGGRIAESTLSGMSFDTAYLGADSINPEFGISTFSEDEAHLNRAMIRACRRIVVLADGSKFCSPALHKICELSQVDILVTDSTMPESLRAAVKEKVQSLVICRSRDKLRTEAETE